MDKKLNKDGYIIIKKGITDFDKVLNSINGDIINYTDIKDFIDNTFLLTIQKNLFDITDPIYINFRFSNNNNSIDASVFHQDDYNHTDLDVLPLYTGLCYFDDAELELIPGSHIKGELGLIDLYKNKKVLFLEKGDIVVFHSNIYHKGLNFTKGKDRRLLQVFGIFPNKPIYNELKNKVKIVNTSNNKITNHNYLYYLSQNETYLRILNYFMLIIVYLNIQYILTLQDLPFFYKKGKIISYEPSGRIYYKDDLKDKININIVTDTDIEYVPYSNFYLFVLILIIISFLLLYINKK
jgi:hypothetical protein